jgi:hypothetical protein
LARLCLLDVDWVTDPMELKSGKADVGTTKFQDAYASTTEIHGVGRPTDRSRYRDYLVAIWTGGLIIARSSFSVPRQLSTNALA